MLDMLKEIGFAKRTKSGVSIGIDALQQVPKERDEQIDNAQKQIKEVEKQYRKGIITSGERYTDRGHLHCTDQISGVMFKTLEQNQARRNTTRFT